MAQVALESPGFGHSGTLPLPVAAVVCTQDPLGSRPDHVRALGDRAGNAATGRGGAAAAAAASAAQAAAAP